MQVISDYVNKQAVRTPEQIKGVFLMSLPAFSMALVVILLAILPLKVKWYYKVILSLLTLLVSFKFYVLRILGGPFAFAPEVPPWVILFSSWLYAILFFFTFFLTASAAVLLPVMLVRKSKKQPFDDFFRKLGRYYLILLTLAAITASCGIYQGTRLPGITRQTLYFSNLPAEAENLRIAVLSDTHVDKVRRKNYMEKLVQLTMKEKPDMIVMTGDYVDGRLRNFYADLTPMTKLKAPYGVFAVPGNHEYFSGYAHWSKALAGYGLTLLQNQNVPIPELNMSVVGITDLIAPRYRFEGPDMEKAFSGIPENHFKLLLSHRPKEVLKARKYAPDLQLSGHTHGGMIWGFHFLVAHFNGNFASGTHQVGSTTLRISNGTGIWSGFPIRIVRPPEILLLTLKRKTNNLK